MKRILMAVALIVVFATANLSAQTTGVINRSDRSIIGGSVDLSSIGQSISNRDYYDDLQFNCQPFYSSFSSERVAIGVSLSLNYTNRTYKDGMDYYNSDSQFLSALLMPHLRFYVADNTFLHLEAGGGYRGYLGASGDGDAMYGGSLSIGRDFPLSDDIFIEAAIGYSMMNYTENVNVYYYEYSQTIVESTLKVSLGVVASF